MLGVDFKKMFLLAASHHLVYLDTLAKQALDDPAASATTPQVRVQLIV